MHDPSTVAFHVRYPWGHRNPINRHFYFDTFITIWHEDPETDGSDDSCGWSYAKLTKTERDAFSKIADQEYSTIFERQVREAQGASYARVCFEPSCYDAIYWSWRRIAHEHRPDTLWKFGVKLSAAELEYIYQLSALPFDNLRMSFREVVDADAFRSFFLNVARLYKTFHRPWYKHPRWHFWHWRLQIHPWQQLRRWLLTRCAGCGKRFRYGESPVSHGWDTPRPKFMRGEVGLYHSDCSGKCHVLKTVEPAGRA